MKRFLCAFSAAILAAGIAVAMAGPAASGMSAAKQHQAATPILVAAAKTGDAGAILGALKIVGKNCGGCHKPYRVPKK